MPLQSCPSGYPPPPPGQLFRPIPLCRFASFTPCPIAVTLAAENPPFAPQPPRQPREVTPHACRVASCRPLRSPLTRGRSAPSGASDVGSRSGGRRLFHSPSPRPRSASRGWGARRRRAERRLSGGLCHRGRIFRISENIPGRLPKFGKLSQPASELRKTRIRHQNYRVDDVLRGTRPQFQRPNLKTGSQIQIPLSIPCLLRFRYRYRFRTGGSGRPVRSPSFTRISSTGFSRRGYGARVPRTADESALVNPRKRGTLNRGLWSPKTDFIRNRKEFLVEGCGLKVAEPLSVLSKSDCCVNFRFRSRYRFRFRTGGSGRPVRSSSFTRISSTGFSRRGYGARVPRTADESALVNPRKRGTLNGGSGRQKFVSIPSVVPKKIIRANPCQTIRGFT